MLAKRKIWIGGVLAVLIGLGLIVGITVSHLAPPGNVRVRFFNSSPDPQTVKIKGLRNNVAEYSSGSQTVVPNGYFNAPFNDEVDTFSVEVTGSATVTIPVPTGAPANSLLGELFFTVDRGGVFHYVVSYGPSDHPTLSQSVTGDVRIRLSNSFAQAKTIRVVARGPNGFMKDTGDVQVASTGHVRIGGFNQSVESFEVTVTGGGATQITVANNFLGELFFGIDAQEAIHYTVTYGTGGVFDHSFTENCPP